MKQCLKIEGKEIPESLEAAELPLICLWVRHSASRKLTFFLQSHWDFRVYCHHSIDKPILTNTSNFINEKKNGVFQQLSNFPQSKELLNDQVYLTHDGQAQASPSSLWYWPPWASSPCWLPVICFHSGCSFCLSASSFGLHKLQCCMPKP